MAESFVNTFKRDYVSRMDLADARTAMAQMAAAFEHFNEVHLHSALKMNPGSSGSIAPHNSVLLRPSRRCVANSLCPEIRGQDQRTHNDPGDKAGRLGAIGPHGLNPPSSGCVSGGDAGAEAQVNLDDDEIYSGTGNNARRGGTSKSTGADSGELGAPSEQLSDTNQPREKNPEATR